MNSSSSLKGLAIVLSLLFGSYGCSTMVISEIGKVPIGAPHNTIQTGCENNAIAYYLPRRLLKATLKEHPVMGPGGNGDTQFLRTLDIQEDLVSIPDRKAPLCLRHNESITATDELGVEVSSSGLLQKVLTKSEDHSGDLIVKAAEGIIEGLLATDAGAPGRGIVTTGQDPSVPRLIANFTFDPFNQGEMRELNNTLFEYGYCLYLQKYNDPFIPTWSENQCQSPNGNRQAVGNETIVAVYPTKESSGVFYRPMLSHRLAVYYSPDPGSLTTQWRISKTVSINLPNAAPTFSVGVERALFAERTTKLTFDDGVLMDVSVQKESELNEFFSIPIRVAQLAVSYPAQLLKIRINRTSNTEALLQAQQNHLLALEKLQETQDERDALKEKQKAGLKKFSTDAATDACRESGSTTGKAISDDVLSKCVEYVRDPKICPATDPNKPVLSCATDFYREEGLLE